MANNYSPKALCVIGVTECNEIYLIETASQCLVLKV
jgi:hypothetical protein